MPPGRREDILREALQCEGTGAKSCSAHRFSGGMAAWRASFPSRPYPAASGGRSFSIQTLVAPPTRESCMWYS